VNPEGRGTLLAGVKDTALIDSTYNANLSSMEAMLGMFAQFPAEKKWVVLGDMLELGEKEQEEHEKLAEVLQKMELERIVLVGKRVGKYTFEALQGGGPVSSFPPTSAHELRAVGSSSSTATPIVEKFENQKEALAYLEQNIQGGEAILFKGSQSIFLEGIIEALLKNKDDAHKLPRRGIFWINKRRQLYE
jgi:UDP-N-acetylmuramoyl-tripeptide--D-alanyl-D-alanine ligase